tara:strand:- start:388 stop:570 length:183 start_codon:yes stop_codon:yes gene_type:complete
MDIFGPDKVLHFVVSFIIALFDPALAVLAGIGKEVYDALGGGVADVYDLVADGLGILAAL